VIIATEVPFDPDVDEPELLPYPDEALLPLVVPPLLVLL
jgi:hypothetical protein